MKKIAMVKDRTTYYPIFEKVFREYGFDIKLYDVWDQNQLDSLLYDSFDGFVWRAKHDPKIRNLARRFIYLFDQEFAIPTYPNWHAYWHYDDKIAQSLLFKKLAIPTPQTHVFVNKERAMAFAEQTDYPIIYKSAHGAGSSNVGMLKNQRQARAYINKVFGRGVRTFFKEESQKDYVYFQEFIPDNSGDYRIICSKDYVIRGFFRGNRTDAPFASGSGFVDIVELPKSLLDFGARINKQLNYDFMSYDLLKNKGDWLITEMGVIYGGREISFYDQAFVYVKQNKEWQKHAPINDIERTARFLIHDVWNWTGGAA